VENKQDYLAQVQVAVSQLHNCGATYVKTVPVHEVLQGKTIWQGDVEVFDLHGHPKAKRAYAWSYSGGNKDERPQFVAVLEIPPVVSAQWAVRVQSVKDFKETGRSPTMLLTGLFFFVNFVLEFLHPVNPFWHYGNLIAGIGSILLWCFGPKKSN
jgi:hypothetical protein